MSYYWIKDLGVWVQSPSGYLLRFSPYRRLHSWSVAVGGFMLAL